MTRMMIMMMMMKLWRRMRIIMMVMMMMMTGIEFTRKFDRNSARICQKLKYVKKMKQKSIKGGKSQINHCT